MRILDTVSVIIFIFTQLQVSSACLYGISIHLYTSKINSIISFVFGLVLLFPTMVLSSLCIFDTSYIKYSVFNVISVIMSSTFILYCFMFHYLKEKIKENCITLDTDWHINSLYAFTIILSLVMYVLAIYYHIKHSLFFNK